MLHHMFTVYDSKSEAYLPPFYAPTRGQAVRSFEDTVNTPDHTFNRHAEDFTLFAVGTFDDLNCTIELLTTPAPIGKAIEFKRVVE